MEDKRLFYNQPGVIIKMKAKEEAKNCSIYV